MTPWSRPHTPWAHTHLPDLSGRTALVTGVTSGLGTVTARELARVGGRVVLAARNQEKLTRTRSELTAELPGAYFEELVVDLADLGSVRRAAAQAKEFGPLDLLVNNAGVMGTPYARTIDGLELQMATNHFGPFLLTGLLLDQLVAAPHGRVVTVSSVMHRAAREAPLEDPYAAPHRYRTWQTYGQSKLANLMFTYALQRRLAQRHPQISTFAAHPGYAGTHLAAHGQFGRSSGGRAAILDRAVRLTAQSPERGAQPTLLAATGDLPGGTYYGPSGPGEFYGSPQRVGSSALSRDQDAQEALWRLSEKTVGHAYP